MLPSAGDERWNEDDGIHRVAFVTDLEMEVIACGGPRAPNGPDGLTGDDSVADFRGPVSAVQVHVVGRVAAGMADADVVAFRAVAKRLDDDSVRRGADAAIWRIWFRLGSERANRLVAMANRQLRDGAVDEAFESLEQAIADSPDFAEAYNQRAILHFNLGAFADSVEDCRLTLERMPMHYGSLAGMGQCLLRLGRDAEAIDAFRSAQEINPGLNLEDLIKELESRLEAEELRV